jgi:hypothetical protein
VEPSEEHENEILDKDAVDEDDFEPIEKKTPRLKVQPKPDDVMFFKYKRQQKLEELIARPTETNEDVTTRDVAVALAKEDVKRGADMYKQMPKGLMKQLGPVYDAIAPMYLGTYPLPPSKVQRPPPEVANKDLHEDKMMEIYDHWILKLAAYAAKDGLVCIFNVFA